MDSAAILSNRIQSKPRPEFGFRTGVLGGTLSSRTIMFAELSALLVDVANESATRREYWSAIIDRNVLGKKTAVTRKETAQRLTNLYTLDSSVPIFRLLRFFWKLDTKAHPLLAVLCACAREPLLQASVVPVLATNVGDTLEKRVIEGAINESAKGSFSQTTLNTIVRNILSSWTQSGHLKGKNIKVRSHPVSSSFATTYALALGYLSGRRGEMLFSTLWANILDQPTHILMMHAQEASRRGWITYRNVGNIIDVDFSTLLTEKERRLVHE